MNSIVALIIIVVCIFIYFLWVTYSLIIKTKKINDLLVEKSILEEKFSNVQGSLEQKVLDYSSLSQRCKMLYDDNVSRKDSLRIMEEKFLNMKGKYLHERQRLSKQKSHEGHEITGSVIDIYNKCKGWAIVIDDERIGYIAGYNKDNLLIIGVNHAYNSYYLPTAGDCISKREYVGYIIYPISRLVFK